MTLLTALRDQQVTEALDDVLALKALTLLRILKLLLN